MKFKEISLKFTQETFNEVVEGLASQGFQRSVSVTEDMGVGCAYRGERTDGLAAKCAVGWLISDDEYVVEMEGLPATDIFPGTSDNLPELQRAHDNGFTPLQMRQLLRIFAEGRGFTIPSALHED